MADPGQAVASALAMRDELDGWIEAARWRQATAKAGSAAKGWSRLSGTKITRQLTEADRNSEGTQGALDLADIPAPSADAHDADRARDQRKRARIDAKAPPPSAEIAAIGAADPAATPPITSVVVEVRRRRKAG